MKWFLLLLKEIEKYHKTTILNYLKIKFMVEKLATPITTLGVELF